MPPQVESITNRFNLIFAGITHTHFCTSHVVLPILLRILLLILF